MGFRFRKSFKVAPGVRVNLSQRGASTRLGPKGLGFTVGPTGKRISAGIPGTGLSYTKKVGDSRPRARPQSKPGLGFLGWALIVVGVIVAMALLL